MLWRAAAIARGEGPSGVSLAESLNTRAPFRAAAALLPGT